MKKSIFLLLIMSFSFCGCEDFLEEEFLSGVNSASITGTEQTFETLVNSSYITLRALWGKENIWDLTEAGTDLYTFGLDNRSRGFCTYESFLTSEEQTRMTGVWREMYKGLNTCNLILDEIDKVPYDDESLRAQRRAETKYLRAYYMWFMVETWGGVHLFTEPARDAMQTVNRTPVDVWYAQIIDDLESALPDLMMKAEGNDYGRPDQAACEAMLARTHLYRKNYTEASRYAQNVINNYDFALVDDYSQIFSIDNIKNPEAIWVVNYSDDPEYTRSNLLDENGDEYNTSGLIQRDGGNQGHVMWEIRYENTAWGMVRDLENGRGFQRWMPTRHFIELYDETIDERFYASFKNTWIGNAEVAGSNKWFTTTYFIGDQELPIPEGATRFGAMFEQGDTAIVFYKNPLPEGSRARLRENDIRQFHPEKGYLMFDINDMYLADGTPNDAIINRQFYFPITKKYEDPTRLELTIPFSKRDAFIFRISEMYLIAAEAEMLGGSMDIAVTHMNALRRSRAVSGREADMEITEADMDIDFILDERARELATEYQRFFDLKRTGKFVERVRAHNTDAAPFVQEYHQLRFIPQSQIDAMENGGSYQNPGY